ncbi:hypothetical protein [Rhodococcus pseudokoreensis]|uniref:hypothetical protein n=1 Tax=Rhodococcus pseudokoreensis TaxID=2811421 RepID=UPI001F1273F6|nr:hypothetical protein [Rhodococcus pseudokoreensis]
MAVLVIPLCSSATVTADTPPVPAATTTAFQVPVRFVAGCLLLTVLACDYPPPLSSVTPSATTGASGVVTFAAERSATNSAYCVAVSVNWRNLTTGVAGTTTLRLVERDLSGSTAPEDRCRYAPATVVTGSGTIAAVADVGAHPPGSTGTRCWSTRGSALSRSRRACVPNKPGSMTGLECGIV